MNNPVQRTEWTMTYVLDNFSRSDSSFSEFALKSLHASYAINYGDRYSLIFVTKCDASIVYGPYEPVDWKIDE